jgi:hypothetical protein
VEGSTANRIEAAMKDLTARLASVAQLENEVAALVDRDWDDHRLELVSGSQFWREHHQSLA